PCGRRQHAQVLAEQFYPTVIGMDHADEHLESGGLTGTVAAQQAVYGPLRHAQVEAVDDPSRVVILGEPVGPDRIGHGSPLLSPRGTVPLEQTDSVFDQAQDLVGRVAKMDRLGKPSVELLRQAAVSCRAGEVLARLRHKDAQSLTAD